MAPQTLTPLAASRSLPFPFTLTGRTENFLRGRPNLDDTIKRLQAFETAGADVLMAPGLIQLTVVPCGASSVARVREKASIAPLDAV